jgi:predicted secreted protein
MPKATYFAIFFLIWWVVLFAVLPWGIRSQHEGGAVAPGTDPGAPTVPKLGRKLIWTTIISGLLFGLFYGAYAEHLVNFDRLISHLGPHFAE